MSNPAEDSALTPKGRNLAVISVGIIVYVAAGATFTGKGLAGGVAVTFDRPFWLEWIGLGFFGYTLWRFLSPPWNPLRELWVAAFYQLHSNTRVQHKVTDCVNPNIAN